MPPLLLGADVTLLGLLCAGCAALAAFWILPPPVRLPGRGPRSRGRPGPPGSVAPAGQQPASAEPGQLARLLAGRPDTPSLLRRGLLGCAAAAAVGLAATRLGLPSLLLWVTVPLLAVGAVLALGWLEPLAARRRRLRMVAETPQALELLAACVAAGMPARAATEAVAEAFGGPVAEDLGRVQSAAALGVPEAAAWRTLRDHPQLGAAAADLARSVESGLRLVESLRQHAARARESRQAAAQVVARSVGVRSVLPLMTCFIPAFLLLGVVPTVVSAVAQAFSS